MDFTIGPEHTPEPAPPRRILMTADGVGGVWSYCLELAHALSRYGTEVALAVMGPPLSELQRAEAAGVENITLHESTFRLEWMDDPWEDVEAAGTWLLSLAERFNPDVVHLNGFSHAPLPWPAPCLVVAHSCVLSWWEAVRHEPLPPSLNRYREEVCRGLAAAQLVTAPSAAMLSAVERLYLPLPNARVIHNARGLVPFAPGQKKEQILSVGRLWDDGKNVVLLAEVAHDLPWPVYVAGEERHPEGGSATIANVKRLGYLTPKRLASWFATASLYVLPARYEPFGLTVLEAAMSGCALVLGDIPTLRELWEGAALFVDPEDSEALAGKVRALCADPVRRNELAQRALVRSRSFTPGRMAAEYLAAYLSLMPVAGAAAVAESAADSFSEGPGAA